MSGFSIILCCYNSVRLLPETLLYLSKLKTNAFQVELILVDNNSDDGTLTFAQELWAKLGCPFTMNTVTERQTGQAFARQTGIKNSKYPLIIFCDDDNYLSEEYLIQCNRIFAIDNSIGIVGGDSLLPENMEMPFWFERYKELYAVGLQGTIEGFLPETRNYLWGAGMAIRKDLLIEADTLGIKPVLTGRKGKSLASGDDSELCFIAKLLNYRFYYSPLLKIYHQVGENRMTWKYLQKLCKGIAVSGVHLSIYYENEASFSKFWKRKIAKYCAELKNLFINRHFINVFKSYIKQPVGQLNPMTISNNLAILRELLFNRRGLKKSFEAIKDNINKSRNADQGI